MNKDRLAYIKGYFAEQEKVKVEVPPTVSETAKGRVITRFNNWRCGYEFKDGIAWIERKDLHFFEAQKHFIIHDGREDKE